MAGKTRARNAAPVRAALERGDRGASGLGPRLALGCAAALLLGLAACGGRGANAVSERSPLDDLFSCQHLQVESAANILRAEDLRDERMMNRLRNLTRVPGAILGNPLSALAFADPSLAIYEEIEALERRNQWIAELRSEKDCDGQGGVRVVAVPPPTAAEPAPLATAEAAPALQSAPAAEAGAAPPLEAELAVLRGAAPEADATPEADAAAALAREPTAAELAELAQIVEARAEDAAAPTPPLPPAPPPAE